MNIHVPEEIRKKYPHIEFRGKLKRIKNRDVLVAFNPALNTTFHYSFQEDFFWFAGQIPDYILDVT